MKLCSKIFFALILLTALSCSKDDDGNDEVIITVSTTDFNVTIDENPLSGQTLGTVQGTTNSGSVSFSVVSQTPNSAFAVDATTGELTVDNEMLYDFETNPTLTGVVKVANGNVSENSAITITLNDIVEGNTFTGNIILTTQAEIDAFGANNYVTINGNLTITDDPSVNDIVFLDALSTITTINGTLTIHDMFNLLDIPEFDNLTSVRGITITDNWGISDFNSFLNISSCIGDITITDNPDLGFFCGLRPLFQNGTFIGEYTASGNFINPSVQDIIDGNCGS